MPILPVGLRGSRDVFPKGSSARAPGKVEVHIGAPIPPEEVERRDGQRDDRRSCARKIMELSAMPPREAAQDVTAPA